MVLQTFHHNTGQWAKNFQSVTFRKVIFLGKGEKAGGQEKKHELIIVSIIIVRLALSEIQVTNHISCII